MRKIKIADVGAANFEIENRWLNLKHDIELVLFEPDKRSYERLVKNGFEVFPKALDSKNGFKSFYLTIKPECSSFYKPNMSFLKNFPNPDRWKIENEVQIEVNSLDSFNLKIDFMKLDTQGSELDILHGATNSLKNILGLEIEVAFSPIYENQPLFGDICAFLYKNGFQFYDFTTQYRYGRKKLDRKGQLVFADALFLRTPDQLLKRDNETIEVYNTIVKAYNKEDLIIFL